MKIYSHPHPEDKGGEMIRFHKQPEDKWGQVIIVDLLNTEPVCCIYAKYHPYAPDIILKALQNYQYEIPTDKCKCGNEKPKEWLHCGCGQYDKEPSSPAY